MDTLGEISRNLSTLTKKQQVISKYILENWEQAAHQTSVAIADAVGMSQASVIRTARALGFGSYIELQHALRQVVYRQLSFVDRLEQAETVETDIETTIKRICNLQEKNLRQTFRNANPEYIRQTINYIVNAEKISVVGMRSTAALASYLGFNLNMMVKKVKTNVSDYSLFEDMRSLNKNDLLIAMSFPRYTKLTQTCVCLAKEQGCPIVAITDSLASPIAEQADVALLASSLSIHFNESLGAAVALCDLILAQLVIDHRQRYQEGMEGLERDYKIQAVFEDP